MNRNKYMFKILFSLLLAIFVIFSCHCNTSTEPDNGDSIYNQESLILLNKYTEGENANTPPGPSLNPGQIVTWKYLVENTGNVIYDSVQISDNKEGIIGTLYNLGPGEKDSVEFTGTAIQTGQYTNIGTAHGHAGEEIKSDSDSSNYYVNPLCGTWVLTLIKLRIDLSPFGYPSELTPEEAGIAMTIIAYADGTFESVETNNGETNNGTGTWSTEGMILTLTYEGSEAVSGQYRITETTLEFDVTIPYEILPGQTLNIPVTLVLTKQ